VIINTTTKEIGNALKKAQKRLQPRQMETLFKRISLLMRRDVIDHFDKERGPSGRWKALKKPRQRKRDRVARLRRRAAGKKSVKDKILQDTGTLKRSFVTDSDATHAKVAVGGDKTNKKSGGRVVDYAIIHNEGLGDMEQREFMYMSKAVAKDIVKRILKHIGGK